MPEPGGTYDRADDTSSPPVPVMVMVPAAPLRLPAIGRPASVVCGWLSGSMYGHEGMEPGT